MYNIFCLNKISPLGTNIFDTKYNVSTETNDPEGILVRSASMHEYEMNDNLLAIARAGAGVNNIPLDKCSEKGIVVFNTPGANANAVKELVIAALFMTSRKVTDSLEWVKTLKGKGDEVGKLVEKGKGAFVGPEIMGKTLGVIGLGAIGRMVANAAAALGMEVWGYDPFLSVDAAWGLDRNIKHALSLDEIYANSDYITIHVPLTADTKYLVNSETIAKMKDNVRILNFSRGDLVNPDALIEALGNKVAAYATDFPTDAMIGMSGIVAFPHLGASTPESEDNCAVMAAKQMKDFIENGNIVNSVNMPAISMARDPKCQRICLLHKNVPNTIGAFAAACGEAGINIENMLSKSRGDYAYTILDVSNDVTDEHLEVLKKLDPIIRVRLIK